jgi:acyl transferase domain-containing protein
VLLGMGRQCVADDASAAWLPSLRKDADPWPILLGSMAHLYEIGVEIDWAGFDAPYPRQRVSAPTYAFGERAYWLKHVPLLEDAGGTPSESTGVASRPAFYEVTWPARPAPPSTRASAPWVVFADRTVGPALAAQLALEGAPVTVVEPGPAFLVSGSRIQLDPSVPEHYARLWAAVGADRPRVVHLWNLDAPAGESLDAARLEAAATSGLASLAHLAQALAAAKVAQPTMWVATLGAVAAASGRAAQDAGGTALALAQAPAWGLARMSRRAARACSRGRS